MYIIIKFLLRNIKEKKMRTFLILFSITISTGLFFASMAISDTVAEMYAEQMKKYFGSSEIIIYPSKDSPSPFFRINKVKEYSDKMEYIIGVLNGSGLYSISRNEKIEIDLQGYILQDLEKMNPIQIIEGYDLESFSGMKLIIGADTAKKYGFNLGDKVDIQISGKRQRFTIWAIAFPQGLFRPEGSSLTMVVPRDTLESIFGVRGKVTRIYIKTKDNVNVKDMINILSKDYSRYTVEESITESDIAEFTKSITTTFKLMLVIVVFISIFIIYSSFMVISMERLPIIGTFRSIGATRKMTDMLLLGESCVYGIVGGALGCILGFGILFIMMNVMAEDPFTGTKMQVEMIYSILQLIGAFFSAVLLSVISSLIPIIRVAKIPVRDIVLNSIQKKVRKSNLRLIVGVILLSISIIAPLYVPRSAQMLIDSLCIITSGISIILLIPYITKIFILIFERLYIFIFGNIGILAAKNLRDNKSIINNIGLLTIGIASILMINTVSYSVSKEIINVYSDFNFEIMFMHPQSDRTIEQRVRSIDGVTDTFGIYEVADIKILEKNDSIWAVYGISSKEYFNYCDFQVLGNINKLTDELDNGRNIILSTILADKFKIKKGDIITLKMKRGNKPYKVIGFVNTMMRAGNIAYISDKYLKRDMDIRYFHDIFIKTNKDPKIIEEDLKNKFRGKNIEITIMDEFQEKEEKNNARIFVLLKGFSILAMIIGIFGILNNFLVSFISRKRSIAIYRSVGMNRLQLVKMLFIEAMTGGLIGGIVGCICGWFFIFIVEHVLKAMNLPVPMHFSWSMFVQALFGGVIISVVASVSPALKSSKLNIIESIKYE